MVADASQGPRDVVADVSQELRDVTAAAFRELQDAVTSSTPVPVPSAPDAACQDLRALQDRKDLSARTASRERQENQVFQENRRSRLAKLSLLLPASRAHRDLRVLRDHLAHQETQAMPEPRADQAATPPTANRDPRDRRDLRENRAQTDHQETQDQTPLLRHQSQASRANQETLAHKDLRDLRETPARTDLQDLRDLRDRRANQDHRAPTASRVPRVRRATRAQMENGVSVPSIAQSTAAFSSRTGRGEDKLFNTKDFTNRRGTFQIFIRDIVTSRRRFLEPENAKIVPRLTIQIFPPILTCLLTGCHICALVSIGNVIFIDLK